ncbi:MAG: xylS [Paenibacillus sp.]|nr:xylS [Paenibacillus sp.]
MSSRGWALLMNTTADHQFDVGDRAADQLIVSGQQRELDFYLFAGADFKELIDRYTDIAGKPQLLPIWAYGLTYLSSIPSSEQSVIDDALQFRRMEIPCDTIDIPWDWMETDAAGQNEMRWNSERFPVIASIRHKPFTFIRTLQRHGFKISLFLVECGYDLSAYEELLLESADRPAESWYDDQLAKFVQDGVSAFVISAKILASNRSARHVEDGFGSSDELHNLLPVLLGKQLHNGFRRQTGRRPMLFGPLGYIGMQQYAGLANRDSDNSTQETVSMLNCCLSGFVHTTTNMPDLLTKEGIHSGFLQTWARLGNPYIHLQHPRFLVEPMQQLFRKYARLRYRLLPYLYSAAYVSARTGFPVMRAMPLAFPHDPRCRELPQQYMLGDYLLVATYSNRVYLPEGVWIDYWTGARYEGGVSIDYRIPEEAGGPLFVRAGAILPLWPDMDYVGQQPVEQIALHLYPHGRSECELYEDDGATFAYTEGEYALTRFRCEKDAGRTRIAIAKRSGSYNGMPPRRSYELFIHTSARPATVVVNGQRWPRQSRRPSGAAAADAPFGWHYDRQAAAVIIRVAEDDGGGELEPIRIELSEQAAAGDEIVSPPANRPASEAAALADFADVLAAALETGQPAAAERAMKAWWNGKWTGRSLNGELLAHASDKGWRLPLLEGCLLLVRHAESRGWSANDVFGADAETICLAEPVHTPAQGWNLLTRLIRQLVQYRASEQAKPPEMHPVIRQILDIVEREIDMELSLHQLASRVKMNPSHLSRLFRQETGSTFTDHLVRQRMIRAKRWLEAGMKVHEAAELTGFRDVKYFSRVFAKYWGVPPVRLRR